MAAEPPLVDVSSFIASPLGSTDLESSQVPSVTLKEDCIMGIDEAGRGPVLGPMVYGTCFCPLSKKDDLERMKMADSKTLNELQREALFRKISEAADWLGWKATILSPNYISNGMLRRTKYNLNDMSHDTAIELIRKTLSDGVKLCEVYVDTVGDPRKYQSKLESIFPQLKITVAKKADSLYPIVSAASICAKVVRDACLKEWKFIEKGIGCSSDFGSGYPSDPMTKQWLKDNLDPVFGYPTIVRFSWSTAQEILDSKALPIKWPDDEEEDSVLLGCNKISKYFTTKTSAEKPPPAKRHRYFEERSLKYCDF